MVFHLVNGFLSISAFLSILVFLAGCAGTARLLMPTPSLYFEPPAIALFEDLPAERSQPRIELLFVTDRAPENIPEAGLSYGEGRAHSLAFGDAVVEIAPALGCPELTRQSRLPERRTEVTLEMGCIEEVGRFPTEPYAMERTPDGLRRASAADGGAREE